MTRVVDPIHADADSGARTDLASDPPRPVRRPRRRARVGAIALAIAAAVVFIGLLIFGVSEQAPNSTIDDSLAQGRAARAPAFELAVLQRGELGARLDGRLAAAFAGGRLGTAELRGIPVVLNIWASWCDPCKQEAPLLERVWRTEGRPGGTVFLGLDQQDLTGDAHAYMRAYGVDYPNVRDPGSDVPRGYGATGIPETYFISAAGRVVDHVIGVISPSELREGIIAAQRGQPVGVKSGGARRTSR